VGSARTLGVAVLAAAVTLSSVAGPRPGYADPAPADLDREVAAAWQHLEVVIEQYDATGENLRATQAQLNTLSGKVAPLAARVEELRGTVSQVAARLYETGAGNYAVLLAAGSTTMLLDQLTTLEHLAWVRQQEITSLRDAIDRYSTQVRTLRALADQESTQQADLGRQKAQLQVEIAHLQALRSRAYGARTSRGYARDGFVPVFPGDPGGTALRFAYRQIGKAYRFASGGPDTYDCSGLTMASWRAAGIPLPHNAAMQWRTVRHIGRDDLRPGDLVFYYRDIHHVALYAGDGRIIEAPQYGEVVSIHPIAFAPVAGYGRPGP
jgi:cell wall-associated NlpC family hydrolase